ncbi:MAG TPA: hypothetical protein VGH38_14575 [Bryobacteraceae bacterium]
MTRTYRNFPHLAGVQSDQIVFFRLLAAAMLIAAACAAESPAAGKWSCTNVPTGGSPSPWTLIAREEGAKLTGVLTDGTVEVPLSQMKLEGSAFKFSFDINGEPYSFNGKLAAGKLEGKYSGEEANGKLQCTRPVS